MLNLKLIKSEYFGGVKCDFYKGKDGDIFMTREQVGRVLEYASPITAITKIHHRHADRLDKFSVNTKLVGTDGKQYETCLYSAKGVYEICRWSRQTKASEFFDWVYDLLEALRKDDVEVLYDILISSNECFTIGQVSKLLNIEAVGSKKLFRILRELNILTKDNLPLHRYVQFGYFKVVLVPYKIVKGEERTYLKTVVTIKGIDFIKKVIERYKLGRTVADECIQLAHNEQISLPI